MKTAIYILAFTISLVATGCSQSPKPLASGLAVSGTIWKNPLSSPSNEGSGIPKDARVEVYDRLIIVRYADGSKQVAPLDRVTDLRLK
jgi:hypothetical protein